MTQCWGQRRDDEYRVYQRLPGNGPCQHTATETDGRQSLFWLFIRDRKSRLLSSDSWPCGSVNAGSGQEKFLTAGVDYSTIQEKSWQRNVECIFVIFFFGTNTHSLLCSGLWTSDAMTPVTILQRPIVVGVVVFPCGGFDDYYNNTCLQRGQNQLEPRRQSLQR